jgi:hypothetical protein
MFDALEQFSQAHQHTIAALGAVSTFIAVVVSLALALLAQRASHTRIMARVSASVILHPSLEGKPNPEYVTVSITNIGNLPALIPLSFFRWKVPFGGGSWIVNPWDYQQHDQWVPQRFLTDLAGFRATMAEMFNEVRYYRWRLRFVRAIVITEDGMIFKAKIDKKIRGEVAKARSTAKALDQV